MLGILIAAGFTTLLVMPVVYWMWRLSKSERLLWLPFLVQLPMSLLLNLTVKSWLSNVIVASALPLLLTLTLLLFVAPFTEETTKLAGLPLGLVHPSFRKGTTPLVLWGTRRQLRAAGMMSGLGFGVGEIWAIAILVELFQPLLAAYPWFFYQGFIIERFEVVFIHGFLALVSYWGYARLLPVSYLAAVGLHAAVNAPVFWLSLRIVTGTTVSLYVTLFSLAAFFVLALAMTAPERSKKRGAKLAPAGESVAAEEVARQSEEPKIGYD